MIFPYVLRKSSEVEKMAYSVYCFLMALVVVVPVFVSPNPIICSVPKIHICIRVCRHRSFAVVIRQPFPKMSSHHYSIPHTFDCYSIQHAPNVWSQLASKYLLLSICGWISFCRGALRRQMRWLEQLTMAVDQALYTTITATNINLNNAKSRYV